MTPNTPFVILLVSLHIFSYLLNLYKRREIRLNGEPDLYGVYASKRETLASNMETFIMCIIIGFTLKHLNDLDQKVFYSEGVRTYFLIFDSVVTFFYKPYVYFGLVFKMSGETTKNLYTLYFIQ